MAGGIAKEGRWHQLSPGHRATGGGAQAARGGAVCGYNCAQGHTVGMTYDRGSTCHNPQWITHVGDPTRDNPLWVTDPHWCVPCDVHQTASISPQIFLKLWWGFFCFSIIFGFGVFQHLSTT